MALSLHLKGEGSTCRQKSKNTREIMALSYHNFTGILMCIKSAGERKNFNPGAIFLPGYILTESFFGL
jgi:hypothetical protein